MFYFRVPFADFFVLSPDLGFLVTVIWVVAMANAVNLIDGLDGLATGVVAIAAGAIFLYSYRLSDVGLLSPDNVAPLVVAITCGLCVGFLPHNFHPAKVFMGDSGALLLGLLLAATTISVGGRTADQFSGQTFFFFAPLIIPFVILGVPVRRHRPGHRPPHPAPHRPVPGRQGAPPPPADGQGHGPRRSVFILWAWTAILSGVVLLPTYTNQGNAVVPFAVFALAVILYTLLHPGVRQTAHEVEEEVDEEEDHLVWPRPAPPAPPAPPPSNW